MTEPEIPAEPAERPYRRLSPLTPLVRGAIFVVAVMVTTWDDLFTGNLGPVGLILLSVLGVGAILGYASWVRTKFWIDDDELRVDTGVIYHQSRRIRIDRLQGIDIVQPFVARLFGLAELKMDVAGGDREGSLAFLPLAEAHQVREQLLARRDAVRRAEGDVEAEAAGGPETWAPPDHDIAKLDLGTLLLSMLLSMETIWLVVSSLVLVVLALATGALVLATAVPVIGGFALVQLRKLSAYYGFTVSKTRVGLQVRRGLLERSTQTIALARVQGVLISEPVLWRGQGWARLDVSIAGYGNAEDSEGGPAATTVMPVAPRALVLELARQLLRGDDDVAADPESVALVAPPRSSRWLDPIARRFMAAGIGEDLVVSREGWFTRRTHVVRHLRVQSLRLTQGPLQRRLGLADLHVDSPPGPVHVRARHRDAVEARELLEQEDVLARTARLGAR